MGKVDEVLTEAGRMLPLVTSRKELRQKIAQKYNISPFTAERYLVARKFRTHFKSGKSLPFLIERRLNEPEIAWFLGWLIGDGALNKKMGLSFELRKADALDIYEKFCKLFNREFSKKERTRQIRLNGRTYMHSSAYFIVSGLGFGLRSKDKIVEVI